MGSPSEIVESKSSLYAIVPLKTRLSAPDDESVSTSSFLVAVSTDAGVSWKFLDGAGVKGDRAKLLKVLPDFPESLKLPETQHTLR